MVIGLKVLEHCCHSTATCEPGSWSVSTVLIWPFRTIVVWDRPPQGWPSGYAQRRLVPTNGFPSGHRMSCISFTFFCLVFHRMMMLDYLISARRPSGNISRRHVTTCNFLKTTLYTPFAMGGRLTTICVACHWRTFFDMDDGPPPNRPDTISKLADRCYFQLRFRTQFTSWPCRWSPTSGNLLR